MKWSNKQNLGTVAKASGCQRKRERKRWWRRKQGNRQNPRKQNFAKRDKIKTVCALYIIITRNRFMAVKIYHCNILCLSQLTESYTSLHKWHSNEGGGKCMCILSYTQEVSYWKISTVQLNSTYLPNNYRRITWKRRKLLKEFRFSYSFNVSVSFVPSSSASSIYIHPLSSQKLNSRSLIRKTAWQIILTMLKIGTLFFFRKWNQQICLYPRNQPIQTNSAIRNKNAHNNNKQSKKVRRERKKKNMPGQSYYNDQVY